MNVISKNKLVLVIVIVLIIIVFTGYRFSLSQVPTVQYEFPLQTDDVEKGLAEQEIDWKITDQSPVNDSHIIYTLNNEKNITLGINSGVKDNHKIFNMTWYLPSRLTEDEVNDFFNNQLSRHFELPGIFYGNKKGLDKALNEVLEFYQNGENHEGIYWSKRVGNDHLRDLCRLA